MRHRDGKIHQGAAFMTFWGQRSAGGVRLVRRAWPGGRLGPWPGNSKSATGGGGGGGGRRRGHAKPPRGGGGGGGAGRGRLRGGGGWGGAGLVVTGLVVTGLL